MTNLIVLVTVLLVFLFLRARARRRGGLSRALAMRTVGVAAAFLYVVIEGSSFLIDYSWWKELDQLATFWQYLRIRWLPQTVAAIAAIVILDIVVQVARRRARSAVTSTRLVGWGGHVVAIILGFLISVNLIDPWTIALYLGAHGAGMAQGYHDPLFGKPLAFFLFRLPFYEMLFGWAAALAITGLVLTSVVSLLGGSAEKFEQWRERVVAATQGGYGAPIPIGPSSGEPAIDFAGLVRFGGALLLVLFATNQFFSRYELLFSPHGFLTGADYVDARWGLPLIWVQIVGALTLAALLLAVRTHRGGLPVRSHGYAPTSTGLTLSRLGWVGPVALLGFLAVLILPSLVEALVRSVYVGANELTLERPYIADHIRATRLAYNIEQSSTEHAYTPRATDSLDLTQYPETAENLRLWNWDAFQNNINQLQALRPYYTFPNVDTDRYRLDGRMRQVLLAARALDTDLLPASAQRWQNLSMQYTHGYGAVAALVNSASPEGQPELLLRDAPPVSSQPAFQLRRPEIYFGEETSRPVYVNTTQKEFNYPQGDDNAYNSYAGRAGISIGRPLMRLAAAIDQNDTNVLLSRYFDPQTRLLLHRQVVARVQRLAPFLNLDADPLLVVDGQGRMFWILDAYTSSDRHPYSAPSVLGDNEINYIRNSVKITVDAYNGTVHFYVFDEQDPLLAAYRRVFPHLFEPRSAMPADLEAHIRYPQQLFQIQADIYRLYHMQDPQVFYNKEDQWDVARQIVSQNQSAPTVPYYLMMQLPGQQQPEFVLLLPFTSHNRDNLIAWLAARCDPAHYGQLIFYRLPKEQLVYGPLQIQSRVDQDRNISKDLSLWNQQGSSVIRGATLVLPVGGTFLYVEPIYIQANQAKMPELKKVVLAVGNRLVYADDLPSAIQELAQPAAGASGVSLAAATTPGVASATTPGVATTTPGGAPSAAAVTALKSISPAVLRSVQQHLRNYQQATAKGNYAQAGQELQQAQQEIEQALH